MKAKNLLTLLTILLGISLTAKANARSIGYRIIGRDGEEGATQIDEQVAEEATIGSIYTINGMRINEMQQGVNILQMSDGTTMKVVIR